MVLEHPQILLLTEAIAWVCKLDKPLHEGSDGWPKEPVNVHAGRCWHVEESEEPAMGQGKLEILKTLKEKK